MLLHSENRAALRPGRETPAWSAAISPIRHLHANGFFDNTKFNFNPFIGSGSIGMCIDEFNGDNFDHGPHVSWVAATSARCRPARGPSKYAHATRNPKWGAPGRRRA